jgi:hypothetical protein
LGTLTFSDISVRFEHEQSGSFLDFLTRLGIMLAIAFCACVAARIIWKRLGRRSTRSQLEQRRRDNFDRETELRDMRADKTDASLPEKCQIWREVVHVMRDREALVAHSQQVKFKFDTDDDRPTVDLYPVLPTSCPPTRRGPLPQIPSLPSATPLLHNDRPSCSPPSAPLPAGAHYAIPPLLSPVTPLPTLDPLNNKSLKDYIADARDSD